MGSEQGKLTAEDITNVIKIAFDCRPGAIAMSLALREPKYQETAAYCHFGREPYTKEGRKYFEWENAKDLSSYAKMSSTEVTAALKSSNYLAFVGGPFEVFLFPSSVGHYSFAAALRPMAW